ncbi:MAG: MBL fold metallo-hydrolase [Henriciella sp.]
MFRTATSLAALGFLFSPLAYAHGGSAPVAQAAEPTPVTTTDFGSGIYMLVGRGGNLGVLTGEDGTFVIDSQYADMAPALLSAVNEIAGSSDVRFLLNTHWHGDHTGGNVAMADAGATIFAHDGVRKRLTSENSRVIGGETQVIPPAEEAAWPVMTYSKHMTLNLNGQNIHIVHLPNAHTDGDSAVHFKDANVLHTGDVMFKGRFPFVDVFSGGTFDGYIAALEMMYEMSDDETRIIPGHGSEARRSDLMELRDVMVASVAAVEAEMAGGKSVEDIIAAEPLAEWSEDWGSGFINAETFIRLIHADLTSRGEAEEEPASDPHHHH